MLNFIRSRLVLTITASLFSSFIAAMPVLAADRLVGGQELPKESSLTSANGCFALALQADGNLVLYQTRPKRKSLWSSKTFGKAVKRGAMQTDGNFVLYGFDNTALWSSNTAGQDGSRLVVQNDGNVVILTPARNRAIWSTGTGNRSCP